MSKTAKINYLKKIIYFLSDKQDIIDYNSLLITVPIFLKCFTHAIKNYYMII